MINIYISYRLYSCVTFNAICYFGAKSSNLYNIVGVYYIIAFITSLDAVRYISPIELIVKFCTKRDVAGSVLNTLDKESACH